MAENSSDSDVGAENAEQNATQGGVKKILVWLVIAVVGIGAGFATPLMLMSDTSESGSNAKNGAENQMSIPDPNEEVNYLEFEEVVANIDDPRFSKYVKMKFSLQVAKSQSDEITKLLEEKHDVLLNWLIGHCAGKTSDDIRGTQGANRLRREIHDAFNDLLFTDGIERIQDILFQELNFQ